MTDSTCTQTLVLIVGPSAVGKMTVGHALSERTGFPLFHNHQTIELVLPYFPFGSPPFRRLVGEFRRRIFEEVAGSELPGLIFTYSLAFDLPSDRAVLTNLGEIFSSRGRRIRYVELKATQEERLRRNETEFRLLHKPSKRDLEFSRQLLLNSDEQYQLNSQGEFDHRDDYMSIDNTYISPAEVVERIMERFSLPSATSD